MSTKSESFGRLLKGAINSIATYEGKTAPAIEDELGQQIGVAGVSIQRYKSGKIPPDPRTVQILAEAAVRRGFLGREWLQRFLHAARYPGSTDLVESLCPSAPERPRPARVYQNLPAPTYSQFIMREQAFAEVLDGLRQRSAVVLIVGLGGNGKTSLAREIATLCLEENTEAPHFDAAVWVSDKDRQGTTNLSIVLDEIARTLDYPGFMQYSHDDKQYEVEQLLRRQKVLLVVDNFETITDGALLSWLLRLPEPSKAIITTREYRREFRRSNWPVELRCMTDEEAHDLIHERLRVLKMEQQINDQTTFDPLIVVTGGNPKAITMTLGLLKHERRPIQHVVDDLYAARGDLFDDLFTRVWALLDESARRVLLVMTFFVESASSEALAATADVQGFAFDCEVERLIDLSLLDIQQNDLNAPPRYVLHPLVQAFARAKIAEQSDFEPAARDRWVAWYVELASKVGYCWNDMNKLETLDLERENLLDAIEWTDVHQKHREIMQLAKGISYYLSVRGMWNKRLETEQQRLQSACYQNDTPEKAEALAYLVQTLSDQGYVEEAERYRSQIVELLESISLPSDTIAECRIALSLYQSLQRDFVAAQMELEIALSKQGVRESPQKSIAISQLLAQCLYEQGNLTDACRIMEHTLQEAQQSDYKRALLYGKRFLIKIHLEQKNLEAAATTLQEVEQLAAQWTSRKDVAQIYHLYARLHTLQGDIPAARTALAEAIDLYERMGMRRELAEAREELANLDDLEVPSA